MGWFYLGSQTGEVDTLKTFIVTDTMVSSVVAADSGLNGPDTASLRPTDTKHKRNEVVVDVVKTVNFCMSTNGEHVRDQLGRVPKALRAGDVLRAYRQNQTEAEGFRLPVAKIRAS